MADKKKYEVLNGLNYGTNRREPGDIIDDVPEKSVAWLVEQGHIREHVAQVPPAKDGK